MCVARPSVLVGHWPTEVYAVNDISESFASWCEGCVCHQAWCKHRQRHQRAAIMEAHCGRHTTTCALAGKNAPQLAAGSFRSFIRNLQADVTVHLMGSFYTGLTEHQRELLHKDQLVAVDHISWVLETKLQFWGHIPHLLSGLGHPSRTTVQRVACEVQARIDPSCGNYCRGQTCRGDTAAQEETNWTCHNGELVQQESTVSLATFAR